MSTISSKLRKWVNPANGDEGLTYWCQGCDSAHGIKTKGVGAWTWNDDVDRPVFGPSVLTTGTQNPTEEEWVRIRAGEKIEPRPLRCHTFVGCNGAAPGEVIFLDDCTHALRGAHPFPDLPDWMRS
jgi:hypothetical protein